MNELLFHDGPHIYMAGKIELNCWRHTLVPNLRGCEHQNGVLPQPNFVYVGPYFIGCDHGGFHGPNQHGAMSLRDKTLVRKQLDVVTQCFEGLERCGTLFAYINAPDCYGTISEIEYALQNDKYVVIVFDPSVNASDFWFITVRTHRVLVGVTLEQLPYVFEQVLSQCVEFVCCER